MFTSSPQLIARVCARTRVKGPLRVVEMRNYIKLRVGQANKITTGTHSKVPIFFAYSEQDDLVDLVNENMALNPGAYEGFEVVFDEVRYVKLNKADVLMLLNHGYVFGNGVAGVYVQALANPTAFPHQWANLKDIFVKRSPRKKGRHG